MPAKSLSQKRLMQAAAHGAKFPMAKKVRASMSPSQLHDFVLKGEGKLPEHVRGNRYHPSK